MPQHVCTRSARPGCTDNLPCHLACAGGAGQAARRAEGAAGQRGSCGAAAAVREGQLGAGGPAGAHCAAARVCPGGGRFGCMYAATLHSSYCTLLRRRSCAVATSMLPPAAVQVGLRLVCCMQLSLPHPYDVLLIVLASFRLCAMLWTQLLTLCWLACAPLPCSTASCRACSTHHQTPSTAHASSSK